ncbi:MAG: hypothetical protein BWY80_00809 [Firmicutes bacterium ADurb.Bin456]|nr:MAG: hypothetical protein BWY80_00809 [Firmicutes bacterium ADurb.Bin456]
MGSHGEDIQNTPPQGILPPALHQLHPIVSQVRQPFQELIQVRPVAHGQTKGPRTKYLRGNQPAQECLHRGYNNHPLSPGEILQYLEALGRQLFTLGQNLAGQELLDRELPHRNAGQELHQLFRHNPGVPFSRGYNQKRHWFYNFGQAGQEVTLQGTG